MKDLTQFESSRTSCNGNARLRGHVLSRPCTSDRLCTSLRGFGDAALQRASSAPPLMSCSSYSRQTGNWASQKPSRLFRQLTGPQIRRTHAVFDQILALAARFYGHHPVRGGFFFVRTVLCEYVEAASAGDRGRRNPIPHCFRPSKPWRCSSRWKVMAPH